MTAIGGKSVGRPGQEQPPSPVKQPDWASPAQSTAGELGGSFVHSVRKPMATTVAAIDAGLDPDSDFKPRRCHDMLPRTLQRRSPPCEKRKRVRRSAVELPEIRAYRRLRIRPSSLEREPSRERTRGATNFNAGSSHRE